MHLILIKKSVYDANPWIAAPLYEAFEESKNKAWRDMTYSGAQKIMLPWVFADIAEVNETFGGDPWPYGIEKNRKTLEALVRHMYDQHMIDRQPRLEELFLDVRA
jgi:4,5-dihydroxyphthalate decarboxylase